MTAKLFFRGYFKPDTWATLDLLNRASGGSWVPHLPPSKGGGFSYHNHVPSGIPTLCVVAEFLYATATPDKSKPDTLHWSLRRGATTYDVCFLPVSESPIHRHQEWAHVFSGECGVIESGHHAFSLMNANIPFEE